MTATKMLVVRRAAPDPLTVESVTEAIGLVIADLVAKGAPDWNTLRVSVTPYGDHAWVAATADPAR